MNSEGSCTTYLLNKSILLIADFYQKKEIVRKNNFLLPPDYFENAVRM